ncbi:DUF1983 domain-containing protein [Candidatus Poseidoniales archaeon]|nr:DUF1983 domain-containing protein [Candidatus Poseidoniales archaeon]
MAEDILKTKRLNVTARGSFPIPKDFSIEAKRFAQSVQDSLQQLKGEKGNVLDKAVTFQDLIDSGIARKRFSISNGGSGFGRNDDKEGVDTPSVPTGVSANGAFQNILVAWDYPSYSGHSHTEIWVANTDTFADRVFLAQTTASVFSHQVGNAATKYYWVRHVNQNNVFGAFNSDSGILAQTEVDIGAVMADLSEEIKNLPGFTTLNTDMSITLSGTQRTLQSTFETINTLATTAQTSVNSLATASTRVIRSDSAPTSRPDSTSLQAGDLWIDTDSSPNVNEIFVYTGSTWAASTSGSTSSSDTTLQTQITANGNSISQNASDLLLVAGVSDRIDISTSVNITSLNSAITNGTTGLAANASAISGLTTRVTAGEGTITTHSSDITELENTLTGYSSSSTIASAISGLQTSITDNEGDITSLSSDVTGLQNTITTKVRTFVQNDPPTATAIGDLWIETDNKNKLYRASATGSANWVAVNDQSGISVFAQNSQPTGQNIGDLWFDTDDNKKQYRYDGSNWVAVDDTRIAGNASAITLLQSDVSTIDGTVSANSLSITALESTVNNAGTGVAATASALSSLTNTVTAIPINFKQSTPPTGTLTTGDLWIDTDDNKMYRWTGSSWESIRDSEITANSQAITALENTVNDGSTGVSATATAVSTLETEVYGAGSAGSSRIDALASTVNNGTTGVAANAFAISTLQTNVDTKNQTFVNSSAPTASAVGDLWINTSQNNKLYRWTGSNWVAVSPSTVQTFAQSGTPTANSVGDLWIDTGNDNQIKRWSGSSWVPLRDGLTTANSLSINAIQSSIGVTFDAYIQTFSGTKNLDIHTRASGAAVAHNISAADVTNGVFISIKGFSSTGGLAIEKINRTFKVVARISSTTLRVEVVGDNATSSATSSTVTDGCVIGTNAGVLQLAETTTNTLGQTEASYVMQVNSNGHIAGFVIQSSTTPTGQQSSDVIFQADRFSIVPSTGTDAVVPFIVDSGIVYIDSARIADGSITNAKIGNLSVDKLTGTFAQLESVVTGTLSADKIKIDGITLDTDENGNLIIKDGGIGDVKIGNISATKITTGLIDADRINVDTLAVKKFADVSSKIISHTGSEVPLSVEANVQSWFGTYPGQTIISQESSSVVNISCTTANVRNNAKYRITYSAVLGNVRNGTIQYSFNNSTWTSLNPKVNANAGTYRTYVFLWDGQITGMNSTQSTVYWRINWNVSGGQVNSTYQALYVTVDNTQ